MGSAINNKRAFRVFTPVEQINAYLIKVAWKGSPIEPRQ